jgi:hypothetical protein
MRTARKFRKGIKIKMEGIVQVWEGFGGVTISTQIFNDAFNIKAT